VAPKLRDAPAGFKPRAKVAKICDSHYSRVDKRARANPEAIWA